MRNRTGLVVLCGALSLLLAEVAFPQRGQSDFATGRLFPPQLIQQHRVELALTREQRTQIRDIIAELQGRVAAIQWEMTGLVTDLQLLLDVDEIDEDAVTTTAQDLMTLENTVKVDQLRMFVRIRNVLSSEQIAYLRALD